MFITFFPTSKDLKDLSALFCWVISISNVSDLVYDTRCNKNGLFHFAAQGLQIENLEVNTVLQFIFVMMAVIVIELIISV